MPLVSWEFRDKVTFEEGYKVEFLSLLFCEGDVAKDETWNVFQVVKVSLGFEAIVEGSSCFDNH